MPLIEKTTKKASIFITSTFEDTEHDAIKNILTKAGHSVYDYRSKEEQAGPLQDETEPESVAAFVEDIRAIEDCDVVVMLLPSGRGSHLEAGYASGQGKRVFFVGTPEKPELMYLLGHVIPDIQRVIEILEIQALGFASTRI